MLACLLQVLHGLWVVPPLPLPAAVLPPPPHTHHTNKGVSSAPSPRYTRFSRKTDTLVCVLTFITDTMGSVSSCRMPTTDMTCVLSG